MSIIHIGVAFSIARDGVGELFLFGTYFQTLRVFNDLSGSRVLFGDTLNVGLIGEEMLPEGGSSPKQGYDKADSFHI